ncbi:expressed unknown protein [Seminavis robusta]|uniref:Uncharacterized protein n=1 Tax=Seminavis robusta TaxID=568900 RepID=A0A9N8F2B1_9STRA|nr:expressed unknown protein [Seminavis robusta]|eukprot:Sro2977_g341390.1 n/a (157) ;mRNA; f:1887-2451
MSESGRALVAADSIGRLNGAPAVSPGNDKGDDPSNICPDCVPIQPPKMDMPPQCHPPLVLHLLPPRSATVGAPESSGASKDNPVSSTESSKDSSKEEEREEDNSKDLATDEEEQDETLDSLVEDAKDRDGESEKETLAMSEHTKDGDQVRTSLCCL